MPLLLSEAPTLPTEHPHRKLWTREQVRLLESTGLFPSDRWELVEGELISTMGKNRPHASALRYLVLALGRIFGDLHVQHEVSVDVAPRDNPINEPEPDVIVTTREPHEFSGNPGPADVLLLVEVADSTLGFDVRTKAGLYARAPFAEYWVLDVRGRRLLVFRNAVEGRYEQVTAYAEHESITPLHAQTGASLVVADLLGPAPAGC